MQTVFKGLGVAAALVALVACNRQADTAKVPDTAAANTAPNGAAVDPHAAIVPETVESDKTVSGASPGEGSTAIGGVVAGQDKDKPRDTGASEPTGGDGATTQPAAAPAK
ncbi:hypothetical protein [Massilia sp. YIM B02443]|uniref:hypothetical protein n=1 Tax=Massilia sp. YIM B02443 TaxID=3050127 RepID=UPI0025B688E6|nr:hypothetical protein [Massilia sp. YIM B02443]MDN4039989.1 hypothetical protein [Massilia sp. YIM B02443]